MCRACIIAEPYFVRYDKAHSSIRYGDIIVLPELAPGATKVEPVWVDTTVIGFVHTKEAPLWP